MDGLLHGPDYAPYLGILQDPYRAVSDFTVEAMVKGVGRRSKRDKPEPLIRGVLAHNVTLLRDKRFDGGASTTAKTKALAAAADTTVSQIQRILSCELGTSLDLVARLARALGVRPQDLLTPYFGSVPDPTKPLDALAAQKFRSRQSQTQTQKTISTINSAA